MLLELIKEASITGKFKAVAGDGKGNQYTVIYNAEKGTFIFRDQNNIGLSPKKFIKDKNYGDPDINSQKDLVDFLSNKTNYIWR